MSKILDNADMNGDNQLNIIDVVALINEIFDSQELLMLIEQLCLLQIML